MSDTAHNSENSLDWAGVYEMELGEHCHTNIISSAEKGYRRRGGGFRYYRFAPSLMQKDKWGNWIINQEYNVEMLVVAICKRVYRHYGQRLIPPECTPMQPGLGKSTITGFLPTYSPDYNSIEIMGGYETLPSC